VRKAKTSFLFRPAGETANVAGFLQGSARKDAFDKKYAALAKTPRFAKATPGKPALPGNR